ncbi:MAG TPA: ISAzo13 family transposase, partial [Acidimicrobiales bacterium]|nr:ISAzo13 family transposase [Acidimicrobiales bacterium]
MEVTAEGLARFFEVVLPHLNEMQRRVVAGASAEMLGRGGKSAVAEASGMSRNTVIKAEREVIAGIEPSKRLRAPGGGDKSLLDAQPGLLVALDELVNPETRGNPMSRLRWTSKSSTNLAEELVAQGFSVSPRSVLRLLHRLGYSLQADAKVTEGRQHPDRDAQFNYLNEQASSFIETDQPVISVDTKKKELIGNYANGGAEWEPAGEPTRTDVHDFADPALGEFAKAIPYGIYDLANNEGWVNVGDVADTAEFAVESIRRWWNQMGRDRFPNASRLLITADAGGSNGYRVRAFKVELAKLAEETGLSITVCHYPPGTSKWNRIEHRMFSFITMNWRGKPLTCLRTIIELISSTTTATGLTIQAGYDPTWYPKGVKVTDAALAAVPLAPHDF